MTIIEEMQAQIDTLQQQADNPLAAVMTGGEVAALCESMGNPNLYQRILVMGWKGVIPYRKASKNSLLFDRTAVQDWIAAYQGRRTLREAMKEAEPTAHERESWKDLEQQRVPEAPDA